MDLAKSAMLVSVTIINGGLLGERRDTSATNYVERKFNVGERRAKASKFLIDRKHPTVKAVVAASQRVREIVYRYTMPWGDDKSRLLPIGVYDEFKSKISEAEAELRAAWEAYLTAYPSLIAASERELGGLFDRTEYPSLQRAREMFSYRLNYWPLPSAGHFVASIADQAATEAKAAMTLEIETRLKEGAYDLVDRAKETVSKFVDKMQEYKVTDTKIEGIFRDSLVSNVKDMSDLLIKMNITHSKDIRNIAQEMKRLACFTADEYRSNSFTRESAIKSGKDILNRMADLHRVDLRVAEMVSDAIEHMDF